MLLTLKPQICIRLTDSLCKRNGLLVRKSTEQILFVCSGNIWQTREQEIINAVRVNIANQKEKFSYITEFNWEI